VEPYRRRQVFLERASALSTELSSRYDPSDSEQALYREWEERGLFHADETRARSPYVIVIPPPNVTNVLHMGHGLNNTIQDVLVRWRRMQGRDTLWLPGTDHAGIATQNVVERELAAEGATRLDLGRDAFVERVWEWVHEYGGQIVEQLKVIGCSCDWSRTRFTLDEGLSRAVREVFVRLYEKELLYRGRYIINWCPRCTTALSNEESEHREHDGKLYHIRYPLADEPQRFVDVATTRPETMLGDTALAVHPEDERYADLVGRKAVLPLVDRLLPIVADEFVDPEFGSGIVKVTPAHDPNDFEIAGRHDLEAIDILTDDARISDAAPEAYRGQDRLEARESVLADLDRADLLVRIEDHRHSIGHCYRCDTVVEPRLSLQWFVRMEPLARPGLKAYRDGQLRFYPERFGRVYEHWMENIRDWCISRQLWWGHRIPVWYCQNEACGEMVVARDDPDRCPECGGALEQDPDVLDTWFSSWLWPFSTLGWPEETADLKAFYPTSTLCTASEILFFWVARMVMAGYEFMGELPFTDVLIHGTVRDHIGRRMSKSLGNGIDPIEVVQLFGADAMRFTLIRGAAVGTDLQLNYEDLESAFRPGRNFANKIWNAVRFALPYLQDADAVDPRERELELADRWILSRFAAATDQITAALEAYRLHEAAELTHAFVWGDFCDWYLELVKGRLEGERGSGSRDAAAATLVYVTRGWLTLLHPVMPFVTEELARRLPGATPEASLVLGPWPSWDPTQRDTEAESAMEALQEFVATVRNLRSEYHVDPGTGVTVHLQSDASDLEHALAAEERGVRRLAGITSVERSAPPVDGPGASAVLRAGTELFVPLSGVIDVDRERTRLETEVNRLEGLLASASARLGNEAFLAKAPKDVVERERQKERSLAEQRDRLIEKRRALGPTG
jgi:valyl-tRNA synthetase